MASLKYIPQSPINGSAEFRQVMAFDKPIIQYRNNSIANHIPQRYLRLVVANQKKLSGKQYQDYKSLVIKHVSNDSVFLQLDDSELCSLAKVRAERYSFSFSKTSDWNYNFFRLNSDLELYGFPLFGYPSSENKLRSLCLRATSSKWWRRVLRTAQARTLESEHVRVGHVSRSTSQLYVSNESVNSFSKKRKRNHDLLEGLEAVNEDGYSQSLLDLSNVSTSNPELRRNELMCRLRGIEEHADSVGLVGEFYTLTCPSSMHRYTSVYKHGKYVTSILNKNYDGSTPSHSQAYLNKQWSKIRAELKRQGFPLLGMRVAEPHHDGTPHWHMLFFIEKEHRTQIRQIFRRYALEINSNEKGAQKHRFTAIKINKKSKSGKSQSAVGYIAKYISKNLSFSNDASASDSIKSDFKNDGALVSESVNRVAAWASLWGIRQFQQIGGERITVWRELRRITGSNVDLVPSQFKSVHSAADKGDYASFIAHALKQKIEIIRKYEIVNNFRTWIFVRSQYVFTSSHHDRSFKTVFDESRQVPIIGLSLLGSYLQTRLHEWNLKKRRINPFFHKLDEATGARQRGGCFV